MKTLIALALLTLCPFTNQEAAQPTNQLEQHVWLEQLVGEWKSSSEVAKEPGGEATTWEFEESIRSIGGLWVVSEGKAENDGTHFTSLMTLGYDPNKEAFVGSWVDTMQTTMWIYTGQLDETQRILTLEAEGPGFEDPSKTALYRDQIELVSPDHKRIISSMLGEDGAWTTYMTVDAHRVK